MELQIGQTVTPEQMEGQGYEKASFGTSKVVVFWGKPTGKRIAFGAEGTTAEYDLVLVSKDRVISMSKGAHPLNITGFHHC